MTDVDPQSQPPGVQDQIENVRGTVARITFRSDDQQFTVLQLDVPDERERLTVVGSCLPFSAGTPVLIKGKYISHPKFGRQLEAHQAMEVAPETEEGLIKYLGGGFIKGVGPGTAKKIVTHFGHDTMEVLYREPERVREIPGIGKQTAKRIEEGVLSRRDRIEIERFFVNHNISRSLIGKIYDHFGAESLGQVKENPYRLASDIRGIGFKTADAIALKLGIEPDSPLRIQACILYVLQKARDDGHCCLAARALHENLRQALEDVTPDFELMPSLESLISAGQLVRCDDIHGMDLPEPVFYLPPLYEAECFVADLISERSQPIETKDIPEEVVTACLKKAGSDLGITFSPEQQDAVRTACSYRFCIVTGGPGCGKTTVIRALAATFSHAGKVLMLAAPTGKAAQRMSEVSGLPAQTIHRLLKFDPRTGGFTYNISNPLKTEEDEQEVDVLIVDEASMIDISLARDLLSALPYHTRLILVGDKDQLPSVGPGLLFSDLVSIDDVKTISLSQLFRRDNSSHITTIAHQINGGITPTIPTPDGITKSDAYFIERRYPEEAARLIETLVAEQIPTKFGFQQTDIMVLTPTNRGPLGALELNKRLQEALNPLTPETESIQSGSTEFRVGDKVCQRVNNYKLGIIGVFNGDLGHVHSIDTKAETLSVELWDGRLVTYDKATMRQLSLSYAMTIHRSQGSEIPCVLMALHESHYVLLKRQLFYTGITRAKQLLILTGSKKALSLAVNNTSTSRRMTYLRNRLQAHFN